MKNLFKYLFYLLLLPLLSIFIYISTAYLFSFFPKETRSNLEKTKEIYLLYSPVHSDIVFNIKDLNMSNFKAFKKHKKGYLAFGWGDKETYLNTPNIKDIKISTSLKALFINTPALMHVSYLQDIYHYQNMKSIKLSTAQQKNLKQSILNSFNFTKEQYRGYGREDFFYTAKGKYNLLHTCNTWTGERLREANISMSYWTPLSQNVIQALP